MCQAGRTLATPVFVGSSSRLLVQQADSIFKRTIPCLFPPMRWHSGPSRLFAAASGRQGTAKSVAFCDFRRMAHHRRPSLCALRQVATDLATIVTQCALGGVGRDAL